MHLSSDCNWCVRFQLRNFFITLHFSAKTQKPFSYSALCHSAVNELTVDVAHDGFVVKDRTSSVRGPALFIGGCRLCMWLCVCGVHCQQRPNSFSTLSTMSVTMSVLLVTSMLPALVGRVGASSATDSSAQDEECGAVSKYAGWRGDARAQYNLGLCALSEALALDSQEGETSGELLPNLTLPTA